MDTVDNIALMNRLYNDPYWGWKLPLVVEELKEEAYKKVQDEKLELTTAKMIDADARNMDTLLSFLGGVK